MKNFVIKLVWFTTVYVFLFAGLCQTKTPLPIISSLFIVGSFLIPYMVYKVLHDNYKTSKTFKDWYNDYPVKTLEKEETALS